jgi:rhamnosyltransferase subunit B
LRVILSNIGTFGDVNPLIAIALELKRRGHVPVLAVPAVFAGKIRPLDIEFHAVRPDIDPSNTALVEMIYDVRKGTERGLREFLFPALRGTYEDLLDAATKPVRADLLLLGELNYAGPLVADVTGIKWASYVLAPMSFFSGFDPPVLPMYPDLARADRTVPGLGRAIKGLARFVSRNWAQPIYDLRRELGLGRGSNPLFDGKHSPCLVLALFSRLLGKEQKDWPAHTRITGFCYYDADAGNLALPAHLEEFLGAGPPPVVF